MNKWQRNKNQVYGLKVTTMQICLQVIQISVAKKREPVDVLDIGRKRES